jgi:hypothetical protein
MKLSRRRKSITQYNERTYWLQHIFEIMRRKRETTDGLPVLADDLNNVPPTDLQFVHRRHFLIVS